jgi:pilus assembly protein CpaB
MNRTRLLMIGALAVAVGVLASVYVYDRLRGKGAGNIEAGSDVLVAADDLQLGSRIEDHDISIVKVPASVVPPNAYSKKSQVMGRGVILPVSKGEFLLPGKLAPENAGAGLPSLIPRGMRAVSVRVNEVVSVAGFVGPGTRVDVLLTGSPGSNGEAQTTTVLQNVTVIAAGHALDRNASGDPQNTPVITLLVTPDDAQKLTLASAQGHIQLSLRNPLDTREDEVASAKAGGLYKGSATPEVKPAPRPRIKKAENVPPPPPQTMNIEVYQGDKKPDVVKFPDQQ